MYRRIKRVPVFACDDCPCDRTCSRHAVCFYEGACETVILARAEGCNPYTLQDTR